MKQNRFKKKLIQRQPSNTGEKTAEDDRENNQCIRAAPCTRDEVDR